MALSYSDQADLERELAGNPGRSETLLLQHASAQTDNTARIIEVILAVGGMQAGLLALILWRVW